MNIGSQPARPAAILEYSRCEYTQSNKPDNVVLDEKNSGLFWSTKFNVTRIGHGGSDPGVRTEMLASLSKDVAIILFVNTSLSGQQAKAYAGLMDELWRYAEGLKVR